MRCSRMSNVTEELTMVELPLEAVRWLLVGAERYIFGLPQPHEDPEEVGRMSEVVVAVRMMTDDLAT